MTQNVPAPGEDVVDELDALEAQLGDGDAADAPDTAEEIARRLGDRLDRVDGADRGGPH